MSCRYLTSHSRLTEQNEEYTGVSIPNSGPACRLGRPLDPTGWAERCRNTSPEGPCWFWVENCGNIADTEFKKPKATFIPVRHE